MGFSLAASAGRTAFADFHEQVDENTGTPQGTTFLWIFGNGLN
jgi:hypothetical protein